MADTNAVTRRRAFLLELRELTRKYGIAVGGCGCCGSPWLDEEADTSDERAGYSEDNGELCWVAPSDPYRWKDCSAGIVRPEGD